MVFAISLVARQGRGGARHRPDPPVLPAAGRGSPSPCRCRQAAATLAATTVGASRSGCSGDDVVNAVVVVIVVQPVRLVGDRDARRRPDRAARPATTRSLGAAIVAAIEDGATALRLAPVLARIAQRDGGYVVPVHVIADGEDALARRRARDRRGDRRGRPAGGHRGRAEPARRRSPSARAIRNEIHEHDGSLLVHRAPRRAPAAGRTCSAACPRRSWPRPRSRSWSSRWTSRRSGACCCRSGPTTSRASRRSETGLAVEVARRLAASGLELVVGRPDGAVLPDTLPVPENARFEPLAPDRDHWIRATAQAGDLVLLPGTGTTLVFGRDAARVAAMPGVSVAVVVGPFTVRRGSRSPRRWARSSRATPRRSDAWGRALAGQSPLSPRDARRTRCGSRPAGPARAPSARARARRSPTAGPPRGARSGGRAPARGPSATTRTDPSASFATNPSRPRCMPSRRAQTRKPTPWTRPRTRASSRAGTSGSGAGVSASVTPLPGSAASGG